MKKKTLLLLLQILFLVNAHSQCFPLMGNSPAFEINIPDGVQVDSAFLIISNYDASEYIRSRGRSFTNFGHTPWFEEDGKYPILNTIISGPNTANFQTHPALDMMHDKPLDYAKYDWRVEIYCSGLKGSNINYSENLTDNLAIPTNIGSVYDGLNVVSGSIDVILQGQGYPLYPDSDHDGFGDNSAQPTIFCSKYGDYMYVDNNLDCDDNNSKINPDQTEIPYNGVDDDCNSATLDDDLDQDGFILASDCDDNNSKINPNTQTEIPYNGVDDDCNSATLDDDLDQDGFLLANDCDDNNSKINPNAEDIPDNGIDEDCDGEDLTVLSTPKIGNSIIKIYPNPASSELNILVEGTLEYEVKLFDLQGRILISKNNSPLLVDVAMLANGTYLLEIKDLKSSKKIIKKIMVER